jgi:hypothetical protein
MTRERLREWVGKLREYDPSIGELAEEFEHYPQYDEEYKVQEWFPSLTDERLAEIHAKAMELSILVQKLKEDLSNDRYRR